MSQPGQHVTGTVAARVAPDRTALIVIDMQNDLCAPGGVVAQTGADLSMVEQMLPRVQHLLAAARRTGVPIAHLKLTDDPLSILTSPAMVSFRYGRKFLTGVTAYLMDGTWGWEILPELRPEPGEAVIPKYRPDGFVGTMLDAFLRANGLDTVVLAGVATHGCVEATARGAASRDYTVVVPRDCVANREPELHEASLTVMTALFDVLDGDDVIAAWETT